MGSLIGKALRNAGPPVPLAPRQQTMFHLPFGGYGADTEGYLRAYGSVGTVWQIVHLLASNVAKPQWKLYRSAPQDGRTRYTTNDQGSDQRVQVVKHQALTVLNQPASIVSRGITLPVWSRFGLMEQCQQYLELTGECFLVVDRANGTNIPAGLWPVRPDRMQEVPDPAAYLKGWVYTSPDGVEEVPLYPDEVIQVKYPNPENPYRGLGPVQSVLVEVDASRAAGEWNRNFFINSARPDGVIQVDHAMDDDEWDALTERWREAHRGVGRAHRVAVLEAGATWVPMGGPVKDMDFPNLRNVSRDLIREAWGIHKIMLGNSDDVNRANAQTGEEVFANWSVAPRLDRWRDALNNQFLPLFGSTGAGVEFDYIYPLPQNREQDNAELTAKAGAAQILVSAGYDPKDVLEVVGLPDMDVAEKAQQAPALPPGWVPEQPAGPGPAASGTQPESDSSDSSDSADMVNRLRKVLANGRQPVELVGRLHA